jgi:hypothetical protein
VTTVLGRRIQCVQQALLLSSLAERVWGAPRTWHCVIWTNTLGGVISRKKGGRVASNATEFQC